MNIFALPHCIISLVRPVGRWEICWDGRMLCGKFCNAA